MNVAWLRELLLERSLRLRIEVEERYGGKAMKQRQNFVDQKGGKAECELGTIVGSQYA